MDSPKQFPQGSLAAVLLFGFLFDFPPLACTNPIKATPSVFVRASVKQELLPFFSHCKKSFPVRRPHWHPCTSSIKNETICRVTERNSHKCKEIPSALVRAGEQPTHTGFQGKYTQERGREPHFQLLRRHSRLLQASESAPAHAQLGRICMLWNIEKCNILQATAAQHIPLLRESYSINSPQESTTQKKLISLANLTPGFGPKSGGTER